MTNLDEEIQNLIKQSSDNIKKLNGLSEQIDESTKVIIDCYQNGHKVIIFGNGGSAADAQHIAAEFIGRFELERKSLAAIALTTDTSVITSLSNDYNYDNLSKEGKTMWDGVHNNFALKNISKMKPG